MTTAETWLLGAGTTLGVVAMTVALLPSLRKLGWRFRLDIDLRHPAVRKGARLGAWALGYAGGYQAGLIVVLVLANRIEGGVAAYQWAFTFFYLPHALFGVPIFNVLFTAMAEHVSRGEGEGLVTRLRSGLAMLGFILLPVAAALAVLGGPLTRVTLEHGVMTEAGATLVARVLLGFAVGLPAYSAFLVMTRAFYAVEDTKTPALVNAGTIVLSSVVGTLLFFVLPDEWAVAGLSLGHSVGFTAGSLVMAHVLGRRVGVLSEDTLNASLIRSAVVALIAAGAMALVRSLLFDGGSHALVQLVVGGGFGVLVYVGIMALSGSHELREAMSLGALLRRRK